MPSPDRMNAGSHVSICSIFYIKKVLISNEVQMYVIFFNLMAISKKNESPLFQTCRNAESTSKCKITKRV